MMSGEGVRSEEWGGVGGGVMFMMSGEVWGGGGVRGDVHDLVRV